jgi:hypothetical protein
MFLSEFLCSFVHGHSVRSHCIFVKWSNRPVGIAEMKRAIDLSPYEWNFDLDMPGQKFHHSLKEHHKISNIPKFRCEMLSFCITNGKLQSFCITNGKLSSLYVCMAIKHMIVLFVETPRKFITAKLSIRKPGSSSVLIIICDLFNSHALFIYKSVVICCCEMGNW